MSIVCITYAMCWECLSGHHFEPPRWHPWADDDDVIAAEAAGGPDPSDKGCSCLCSDEDEGRTAVSDG